MGHICQLRNIPKERTCLGKLVNYDYKKGGWLKIIIISLLRRLHLNDIESPLLRDVSSKCGWNWSCRPAEEDRVLNVDNVFFAIVEKCSVIHLYKLDFPLSRDALYQVWLKLIQWLWRRRFLHVDFQEKRYFSMNSQWSPIGKGCGPTFGWNKNQIPCSQFYMRSAKFG